MQRQTDMPTSSTSRLGNRLRRDDPADVRSARRITRTSVSHEIHVFLPQTIGRIRTDPSAVIETGARAMETRNSARSNAVEASGSRVVATGRRRLEASSSRSAAPKNNKNTRVDKEVQTDKSEEIVNVPVTRIKRRGRSISPTCLPCAICFNEMLPIADRPLTSLKCGHIFCSVCIDKCYDVIKFCPLCYEPMNKKQFRKIYL